MSVRDFALPVPRTGSIEADSGYGQMLNTGQELHSQFQREKKSQSPDYKSEVALAHKFVRDKYTFHVSGRLDGLWESPIGDPPVIEEIKTADDIVKLAAKLKDNQFHPYCLQLATYGYIFEQLHGAEPKLRFQLISARTGEQIEFPFEMSKENYERWLNQRLDELLLEVEAEKKNRERRIKIARSLRFPFDQPRTGQLDMIQTIEDKLGEFSSLLVQAPTGLGKTVAVSHPLLKHALERGEKLIYVTPKNSQHEIAEELIKKFQKQGSKLKALTITAKRKLCMKDEPICNPDYCEYARDYYGKVWREKLLDKLAKHRNLNGKKFKEFAAKHEVCPFELSLDAIPQADVIIGDYNYVFSPYSITHRFTNCLVDEKSKPNLVIDELHNLPERAMGYYSSRISTFELEEFGKRASEIPAQLKARFADLISQSVQFLLSLNESCATAKSSPGHARSRNPREDLIVEVKVDHANLEKIVQQSKDLLAQYLKTSESISPNDPIIECCWLWFDFADICAMAKDRPEFVTTLQSSTNGLILRITCCDASSMLAETHEHFDKIAGFSATLKPFDYYVNLSGFHGDKAQSLEFTSPFPSSNRKLLVIPQVSTKYSDRKANYDKIADAVLRIASIKEGNYICVFPSFDFLDEVAMRVDKLTSEQQSAFQIIRQEREMNTHKVKQVLSTLEENRQSNLLFAVQGGVLSEGIDYRGDMLIGAFIIGPGLPKFDQERELLKRYFQERYGAGFDYAYTYPAMTKVIQSAGRVIRSEKERGLIVLFDKRFTDTSYAQSMPRDWYQTSVNELVSNQILADVRAFWSEKQE